jgi:hypothetical protein
MCSGMGLVEMSCCCKEEGERGQGGKKVRTSVHETGTFLSRTRMDMTEFLKEKKGRK